MSKICSHPASTILGPATPTNLTEGQIAWVARIKFAPCRSALGSAALMKTSGSCVDCRCAVAKIVVDSRVGSTESPSSRREGGTVCPDLTGVNRARSAGSQAEVHSDRGFCSSRSEYCWNFTALDLIGCRFLVDSGSTSDRNRYIKTGFFLEASFWHRSWYVN